MAPHDYYLHSLAIQRIGVLNVLNVEDTATMLGITPDRVRHLAAKREIPFYKRNGKLWFKKSEVEEWLTSHRVASDDEITVNAVTQCAINRKRKQ